MFESFLGWSKASKCKALLKIMVCRIRILRNKREILIKQLEQDVSQLLMKGYYKSSFVRVDSLFKEQNLLECYDMLEKYCECIRERLPYIRKHKDRPDDIEEAASSLIFASARCADLPELQRLRTLLAKRYGQEFASSSVELLPPSKVNQKMIEKLTVTTPSNNTKLNLIKDIARTFNLRWDSSIEAQICEPTKDPSLEDEAKRRTIEPDHNSLSLQHSSDDIKEHISSKSENYAFEKGSNKLQSISQNAEKVFDRDIPVVSGSVKEVDNVPNKSKGFPSDSKNKSLSCNNADSDVLHGIFGYASNNNGNINHENEISHLEHKATPTRQNYNTASKATAEKFSYNSQTSSVIQDGIQRAPILSSSDNNEPTCNGNSNEECSSLDSSSIEDDRFPNRYDNDVGSSSGSRSKTLYELHLRNEPRYETVQIQGQELYAHQKQQMKYKAKRSFLATKTPEVSSPEGYSDGEPSTGSSQESVSSCFIEGNKQGEVYYDNETGPHNNKKYYFDEFMEDSIDYGPDLGLEFQYSQTERGTPSRELRRRRGRNPIDINEDFRVNAGETKSRIRKANTFCPSSSRTNRSLRKSQSEKLVRHKFESQRHSIHTIPKEWIYPQEGDEANSLPNSSDQSSCISEDFYLQLEITSSESEISRNTARRTREIGRRKSIDTRKHKIRISSEDKEWALEGRRQKPKQTDLCRNGVHENLRPRERKSNEKQGNPLPETLHRSKQLQIVDEPIVLNISVHNSSQTHLNSQAHGPFKSSGRYYHSMDSPYSETFLPPRSKDSSNLSKNFVSKSKMKADNLNKKRQQSRSRSWDINDIDVQESGLEDHYYIPNSSSSGCSNLHRRSFEKSHHFQPEVDNICRVSKRHTRRMERNPSFQHQENLKQLKEYGNFTSDANQERSKPCSPRIPMQDKGKQIQLGRTEIKTREATSNHKIPAAKYKIFEADYAHIKTKHHSTAPKLRDSGYIFRDDSENITNQNQDHNRNSLGSSSVTSKDAHDNADRLRIMTSAAVPSSKPPNIPSPLSHCSPRLPAGSKPNSPDRSVECGQKQTSRPPQLWQRFVSLPPDRSRNSPIRSATRSESLGKERELRSCLQSPRTPHVHPKLPDYDDLAAKFAALKQQHRSSSDSQ